MEVNRSFIADSPMDLNLKLYVVGNNIGAVNLTDKKSAQLVQEWFLQANQEICRAQPSLRGIFRGSVMLDYPQKKIFMRLVNRLHEKAKLLKSDREFPKELNNMDRMTWECNNYKLLLEELQNKVELPSYQPTGRSIKMGFENIFNTAPLSPPSDGAS